MRHDDDRKGRPPYPYRALPPGPAAAQAARARRILVASAVIITAGVAGILVLIYPSGGDIPAPVAQAVVEPPPFDWDPSPAVSMLPAPASSFTSAPATSPATPPARSHRPAPTGVTRPVRPAPVVDLTIGRTVGLSPAGRSDLRLRHHDFVGRVDRIGSRSAAGERADSRFVVRKGLGRGGCVSLESVNFPGYFLRHRNFVLRLEHPRRWERRGGPELFERDATFCTSPTRDGAAFILESINYPDRALSVHADGVVGLDRDDPTAFVVRPPL
ncbi:AbfB domain-containing protein [Paractinoplanes rhizophilus]|uniref:AbfB domain-containing protein n=1 Tax=Paractinoplanes rhizophilus TaxID=1416877 RepID=A0ABW2HV86_9ACTN